MMLLWAVPGCSPPVRGSIRRGPRVGVTPLSSMVGPASARSAVSDFIATATTVSQPSALSCARLLRQGLHPEPPPRGINSAPHPVGQYRNFLVIQRDLLPVVQHRPPQCARTR